MKGALVTGGGVRIGRAFAMALAEDGYFVFVHYNRSAAGARDTEPDGTLLRVTAGRLVHG